MDGVAYPDGSALVAAKRLLLHRHILAPGASLESDFRGRRGRGRNHGLALGVRSANLRERIGCAVESNRLNLAASIAR